MTDHPHVTTVTLDPRFTRLLETQNSLQGFLLGEFPGEMEDKNVIEYLRNMTLALQAEVHEVLDETHWKPWAERPMGEPVIPSKVRYIGELSDVFIFFMNLMLAGKVTMTELAAAVEAKQQKNLSRWISGTYDGKSNKCPACKRSYDDSDVKCYRNAEESGILSFCAYKERFLDKDGDVI